PDPWRDRFRQPQVWQDKAALAALAAELGAGKEKLAEMQPASLAAFGRALISAQADAVPVLSAAPALHLNGFWLNFFLGNALRERNRTDPSSLGYFRAALAIRPDSVAAHNNLGVGLYNMRQLDEAARELRTAIALDPNYAKPHNNLAVILGEKG